MRDEGIVVYAGEGSSHSWAWLADLFESRGILDVRFLDAPALVGHLDGGAGTVIVSGGDGLLIAEAFRGSVFSGLQTFVRGGGRYVGMCAGAYLPLPSSLPPLDEFNLSTTRIENIGPLISDRAVQSPRLAVRYGSCSIVHPFRGPVELRGDGVTVRAPLYGGPVFRSPAEDEVVLRYGAFTDGTEFQVERARAERLVLGKPAVIRSRCGSGELLLLGPHLEHPKYPEANEFFLKLIGSPAGRARGRPGPSREDGPHESKARLGDLKVAVLGLENRSFVVGNKLWDGGRLLELTAAIQKRVSGLDEATQQSVAAKLARVRSMLVGAHPEVIDDSDSAPGLLVDAARECVDRHFAMLRGER